MTMNVLKRIKQDILKLSKEPLDGQGIYVHFNEDNMFNLKAMIFGSEDTPYEKGFYFFDITFPDDYPLSPPKIKFCTTDGKIRFNPNLYENGYVCLSIINTWFGEGWSPANSISTVLLSLLSYVFVKTPLNNEPGYESVKQSHKNEIDIYNDATLYNNYSYAIIEMVKKQPDGFDVFSSLVKKLFLQNVDWYRDKISEYRKKYDEKYTNKQIYVLPYGQHILFDYSPLMEGLVSLVYTVTGESQMLSDAKHTLSAISKTPPTASKDTPSHKSSFQTIGEKLTEIEKILGKIKK